MLPSPYKFTILTTMQLINNKRFWRLFPILQVLIFILVACSESLQPKPFSTIFELPIGSKKLFAEIAITDTQKACGLMFRTSLAPNGAMVFVYDAPQKASFWMKNTEIPLDIAFLNKDGEITEIKKLYPNNLNPVISASKNILFCIETNQDWFANNGVSVGDKLNMNVFRKALESRKMAE